MTNNDILQTHGWKKSPADPFVEKFEVRSSQEESFELKFRL